jgi:hypothetical protein
MVTIATTMSVRRRRFTGALQRLLVYSYDTARN